MYNQFQIYAWELKKTEKFASLPVYTTTILSCWIYVEQASGVEIEKQASPLKVEATVFACTRKIHLSTSLIKSEREEFWDDIGGCIFVSISPYDVAASIGQKEKVW